MVADDAESGVSGKERRDLYEDGYRFSRVHGWHGMENVSTIDQRLRLEEASFAPRDVSCVWSDLVTRRQGTDKMDEYSSIGMSRVYWGAAGEVVGGMLMILRLIGCTQEVGQLTRIVLGAQSLRAVSAV